MTNIEDREWKKGPARLNRTISALMARGVDYELAERLHRDGYSLRSLMQLKPDRLASLGISGHAAQNILKGARPPIPISDLAGVLFANRFTCCVCRDRTRSIIVHHIVPWAKSRDHSRSNLSVLCLEDHDRAHKTGGLTQNLTPALVRQAKGTWEGLVSRMDAKAVLEASRLNSDAWWLFNHVRLFELADNLKVDIRTIRSFGHLPAAGIIDESGLPLPQYGRQSSYFYEGENGLSLYRYVRDVLYAVLERLTALNISDDLDRGSLPEVVAPGDFIIVQGAFAFQSQNTKDEGPGQRLTGTRKANGVEIYFAADRWEATANSAWSLWLRGRQDAMCLLRVMAVEKEAGSLRIGATALAVGAALQGLKTREYSNAPYRAGYISYGDDEEPNDGWLDGSEDDD